MTPRARIERSRTSPQCCDAALAEEIDRLASRFGGREALIAYMISKVTDEHAIVGDEQDNVELREPSWGRYYMEIQLSGKDLRRLDEEAQAFGAPRHRWIVALIRKRLHGGHQFSRSERIHLANIARQLRKIEAQLFRIVRVFSGRHVVSQDLLNRLDEVSDLQSQIARMSIALGEAFRGDDEYWRQISSAQANAAPENATDGFV